MCSIYPLINDRSIIFPILYKLLLRIVLDCEFKKINEFKYLGVTVRSNNKQEEKIQNRLAVAQSATLAFPNS